jgi:hypothetical protein
LKALEIIALLLLLQLNYISRMFFLPEKSKVERSINVGVKNSFTFNYIKYISTFNEWNPWNEIESAAETYLENEMGRVGSLRRWKGKELRVGNMKIVFLQPHTKIHQKLISIEPCAGEADNDFMIQALGNSTKATYL